MVTWRQVDPTAPWYGGAVIAKLHGVAAADWPGTGSQSWTFPTFNPASNFLFIAWYDADPGDVWAVDYDGSDIRTGTNKYPGGEFYTLGTDPVAGHLPPLSAGDDVWLVAAEWGPTSPPDPTTPETWDPTTDFGEFFDGDNGAGTNIGPPWALLEEIARPIYGYSPWRDAPVAYVATNIPSGQWSRYAGTGTSVALAADAPDVTQSFRKSFAEALAAATGAPRWSFDESLLLGDASGSAGGPAPGTGPIADIAPPGAVGIEWESDAGEWTGLARFSLDIDAAVLGDDDAADPAPSYTGWYADDRELQMRLVTAWTTTTDDFGNAGTVAFIDGWQSAADLAALASLGSQPLALEGASSREIVPVRTDLTPIDLADARLVLALCLDAQVDHLNIGTPPSGQFRNIDVIVIAASLELEYQPPRYRYIYNARPPLAHRQRRDGVASAGPPLAHFGTTGATRPTLAHRQASL